MSSNAYNGALNHAALNNSASIIVHNIVGDNIIIVAIWRWCDTNYGTMHHISGTHAWLRYWIALHWRGAAELVDVNRWACPLVSIIVSNECVAVGIQPLNRTLIPSIVATFFN